MRCADLMTSTVHTCREDATAAECARLMGERSIGFVPVVDADGRVVGVVTDRDLAVRVLGAGRPPRTRLAEVMTARLVTASPHDDLREVERAMADARISRIVVTGPSRRCLGIVSLSDIARVEEGSRAAGVLRAVSAREAAPPPPLR